jgi:glycogen debranching enzyme
LSRVSGPLNLTHPANSPVAPEPVPAQPKATEWLLTDGRGGYACGTVADLATRRYHGLWVARLPDSARRQMIVSGLHERIGTGDSTVSLLHAHWMTMPQPMAPQAVVTFEHRPWPCWTFRGVTPEGHSFAIERSVQLQRTDGGEGAAEPCLCVRWRNLGSALVRLSVRPLLGLCDADHLPPANDTFDGTVHVRGASWGFRPAPLLPTLWLTVDGVAAFRGEPVWYRGFLYAEDKARGYDHQGDRWSPGVLELDLGPGQVAVAAFSIGEVCREPGAVWDAVSARANDREHAVVTAADPLRARLDRTADDFFYRAVGDRPGVLAGYPWFGEWGRDVFVALPGLSIARGNLAQCEAVLTGALPFLRTGLLPNIYGRTQADSNYGSCDAALWFGLAVQRFAAAGGNAELVRTVLVPALASIADAYVAGTELGLAVDAEGLLLAGREDLNATWMDARTGRGPVTPRAGQPVEIQALWYSLLAVLVEHGETRWKGLRDRCGEAFVRRFWRSDEQCLADRVQAGVADPTVRPNMVLAAALPYSPLSAAQRAGVVKKAAAELLTPRGLRTLSSRDPAYRPRYEGGIESRDGAYHQGTAWPWLGGFYVEAALRAATRQKRKKVAGDLRAWLDGFLPELDRAGLDHVSEVFDGDQPQRPGGTFAQAWNSGELLRALWLCEQPVRLDQRGAS